MDDCVSFSLYIRHSPETEVNVRSPLVLSKKNPKYSQLADKTYLNLKYIYIRTNGFSDFLNFLFWPKTLKRGLILA